VQPRMSDIERAERRCALAAREPWWKAHRRNAREPRILPMEHAGRRAISRQLSCNSERESVLAACSGLASPSPGLPIFSLGSIA